MTERSRFWDSTTTGDAIEAPYDATTEFAAVLRSLAGGAAIVPDLGGVFRGELNALSISGVASPITVETGRALVYGTWYENDAAVTVAIPTPSAGNDRIDTIALRKDWSAQTVRITRIAGVAAPVPVAPALTQNAGTLWDVPLATIYITDAGAITIFDVRAYLPLTGNIAEANLAADVDLAVANQYYDGPSVELGVGTWLLIGTVTIEWGTVNSQTTAKLWNGITAESSTQFSAITTGSLYDTMSLAGIVTVAAATEDWRIAVASDKTDARILAAAPHNGAGNNASFLRAVRLY